MEAELSRDMAGLESQAGSDPAVVRVEIAPRKADLDVERVVLVWVPWRQTPDGQAEALCSL